MWMWYIVPLSEWVLKKRSDLQQSMIISPKGSKDRKRSKHVKHPVECAVSSAATVIFFLVWSYRTKCCYCRRALTHCDVLGCQEPLDLLKLSTAKKLTITWGCVWSFGGGVNCIHPPKTCCRAPTAANKHISLSPSSSLSQIFQSIACHSVASSPPSLQEIVLWLH